jgi:hypothetical protein
MPRVDQMSAEIVQPSNGDPFFEHRTHLFLSGFVFSVLKKKELLQQRTENF